MSKRELIELAREMRKNPTPSEEVFWQAVRSRRLNGVKFRRQQVIEQFIVDFFVPSHRLIIEIDGGVHRGREEHDSLREQFLMDCGLRVLRFRSGDLELRLDHVLYTVRTILLEIEGEQTL